MFHLLLHVAVVTDTEALYKTHTALAHADDSIAPGLIACATMSKWTSWVSTCTNSAAATAE